MEFNLETIFWISAVAGSTFFILKTATMFLGMGDQFNIDIDDGSDLHGLDSAGAIVAFKFLSLTGITTFLMMFGWGGLVAINQYKLNTALAVLLASVVGVLAVFVIALVFKYAMKLHSGGAEFAEKDIIGLNADVYSRIPAEGTGRIQINVGGLIREMDASSVDGVEIASHQKVEVVGLLSPDHVTVKISSTEK